MSTERVDDAGDGVGEMEREENISRGYLLEREGRAGGGDGGVFINESWMEGHKKLNLESS